MLLNLFCKYYIYYEKSTSISKYLLAYNFIKIENNLKMKIICIIYMYLLSYNILRIFIIFYYLYIYIHLHIYYKKIYIL